MHDRFSRRGFTAALATVGAGLLLPVRAQADDLDLSARLLPERRDGRAWLALYLRHPLETAVVLPAKAIELQARFDGGRMTLRAPEVRNTPMLRSGRRRALPVTVAAGRWALYDRFAVPRPLEAALSGRVFVQSSLLPDARQSAETAALARISSSLPLPLFEDESLPPANGSRSTVLRGGPRVR